jgi:hypothetical protein
MAFVVLDQRKIAYLPMIKLAGETAGFILQGIEFLSRNIQYEIVPRGKYIEDYSVFGG